MADLEEKSYKTFSLNMIMASVLVAIMGIGCVTFVYFAGNFEFTHRKAASLPLLGIFLIALAALGFANTLFGMPKLILSKSRISVRRITGTYFADWTSLGPFELGVYGGGINAQVIGPDVDAATMKMGRFNIGLDGLRVAGDDLLAELTKRRAEAFQQAGISINRHRGNQPKTPPKPGRN